MSRLQRGLSTAEVLQGIDAQGHDAAWPMPLIHQTLDDTQFFDLRHRINTLVIGITAGGGKAIAALPHAECVFANSRVALDSSDGKRHL